jgi:predicted nucleic acid-binding protein
MTAFVDTSFYIARIMPRDRWHEKALRAMRPGIAFCTSTFVINETISLLQARGFFSAAISFLRETRLSQEIWIVYPDAVMQLRRDAKAVHTQGVYFRRAFPQ